MQVSELWALRSMMPGFRPSVPPRLTLTLAVIARFSIDLRRESVG
jgi:hypothetical protein